MIQKQLDNREQDLITGVLRSDNKSISKFYLLILPIIKHAVRMAIFNLSHENFQDIVSDVAIKIIYSKALHSYDYSRKLKPFIQKITFNHCIDLSRRKANKRSVGLYYPDGNPIEFQSQTLNPEQLLIQNEDVLKLRKILKGLKPEKKEMLFLITNSTSNKKELAKDLGKSATCVCVQWSRLKNDIKSQLYSA